MKLCNIISNIKIIYIDYNVIIGIGIGIVILIL
jgi:hypothetical protein